MCMVYFVGAARPLPLVAWNPDAPDFHVGQVSASESGILERFTKASAVFYLGSHLNCGCGFRCETLGAEADEEAGKQDAHEKLADYLIALPPDARPIQIYGCWSGEEAEPTERLRRVAVTRIRDVDFEFRERELLTVSF